MVDGDYPTRAQRGTEGCLWILAALNVLSQGAIDLGLISPPARNPFLEPSQHVGVVDDTGRAVPGPLMEANMLLSLALIDQAAMR